MAARATFSNRATRLSAWSREVQQMAVTFVKYGSAAYVIRKYLVGVSAVRGDLMLVEHFSVFAKTIKVGDVVTAHSVRNPRHILCKRVLGLEGDIIRVPWSSAAGPSRTVKVPPGHVWLQGDNTLNSIDSRHYGPVPYSLLISRVFAKVWPPSEAGWIESKVPAL